MSWRSDLPSVTFLHERLPDDYLELKPEIYHHRKAIAEQKLMSCLDYLTVQKCRAQQLISYFGMTSEKCGKCDVCATEQQPKSDQEIELKILNLLRKAPMDATELQTNFKNAPRYQNVLRTLILNEKILFEDDSYRLN